MIVKIPKLVALVFKVPVEAKLLDNVKDRTILVINEEENIQEKNGYRQRHSKIQITKILSKDGKLIVEASLTNLKTN